MTRKVEELLINTPGVGSVTAIGGYSLLTSSLSPNNTFLFVSLTHWSERDSDDLHVNAIIGQINRQLALGVPEAIAFAFGPPAIPGLGTGSGFSMMLQDRGGNTPEYLARQTEAFMQAAQQLAAQTARISVAEALRFPSLSLTGTLGLATPELDDFFSSDNKAWGLSADLLGPVFDAGRNKSRVEAERARTEQLLKNYELTVLRAFQEVENSLIDISTYRDEALARQRQVVAARSGLKLSFARYNGGVTSYLEVLESDRSLFRAELLASSTSRQQLVSIISLYKALNICPDL